MGERLVVSVNRHNKTLCTIYYHWSGYTGSQYEVAQFLIHGLHKKGFRKDETSDKDLIKMLIQIIKENRYGSDTVSRYGMRDSHGGLCEKSLPVAKELFDGDPDFSSDEDFGCDAYLSRNLGLLDISEAEMAYAISWGEHFSTLDIDNESVTNDEFGMLTKEQLSDLEIDISDRKVNIYQKPDFDPTCVPFDRINDAVKWYYGAVYRRGILYDPETDRYITTFLEFSCEFGAGITRRKNNSYSGRKGID